MKKLVILSGVVMAIICAPVFAETGFKAGFVDIQKVLTTSTAGQKVKKEIKSIVSKQKKGLEKQQDALATMQESFKKEELTMSVSQKKKKQQDFQKKVKAYQQSADDLQKTIKKKEAEFTRKALLEIKDIVNDIAKKDNYNVLLEVSQSGMLYADDNMDLTERVLKQFNIRFGG